MTTTHKITIYTACTRRLKDAGSPYPTAFVKTSKGYLLVMVIGENHVRVRTLQKGDQEIIGDLTSITQGDHYLKVNRVQLQGHIDLRPTGWESHYPDAMSRQTKDLEGWIQRKSDALRFHRRGEYSWSARGKMSESAKLQVRDVCQRAAALVLRRWPEMVANGSIAELQGLVNSVGSKLDKAYELVDDLTEEYAAMQEKLSAKQAEEAQS